MHYSAVEGNGSHHCEQKKNTKSKKIMIFDDYVLKLSTISISLGRTEARITNQSVVSRFKLDLKNGVASWEATHAENYYKDFYPFTILVILVCFAIIFFFGAYVSLECAFSRH